MRNLFFFFILMVAVMGCGRSNEQQLFDASGRGDLEEVKRLSKDAPSLNYFGYDGFTPLTIAAMNERWNVVVVLVENGADVTLGQKGGLTAIEWARRHHNKEMEIFLTKAAEKAAPHD